MSRRALLSARAALVGWLAATLVTCVGFELPELWRNAPNSGLLLDLASGVGLWAGFTLLVCSVGWCVAVLPVALLLPAAWIVRLRWLLALASGAGGVAFIGSRLGTWHDYQNHGPLNPLTSPLFLNYAGFAFIFAAVTTLAYARLLSAR